jgi:hypothetical protein
LKDVRFDGGGKIPWILSVRPAYSAMVVRVERWCFEIMMNQRPPIEYLGRIGQQIKTHIDRIVEFGQQIIDEQFAQQRVEVDRVTPGQHNAIVFAIKIFMPDLEKSTVIIHPMGVFF